MHPKFTLAILIIGISGIAKGQTSRPDPAKTSGKENVTTYQQGHVYDMMIVNDKMIGLEVDNKRIDPADFHRYDSILQAIRSEFKEDNDRQEEERAEEKRDGEQADRDREQAERDREQAVRDRVQGEQDRKEAERDQEEAVRDRAQARQDQQQAVKDREQGQRDREQGERDRKEAEAERRMMRDLLDDLVTEKIAPDVKSINSFVLTDTELVVNDKKQSPQLQQKMKDKYGKWAKCGISYTR
jgi:colicin import membrane protein